MLKFKIWILEQIFIIGSCERLIVLWDGVKHFEYPAILSMSYK